jgi:hypothetical protein
MGEDEWDCYRPDYSRAHWQAWSDGLLVGVRKNYNFIKKVKGNVMVLYDFLHDEHSVYPRAWVVRFGFFFEGLPRTRPVL